MNINKVNTHIIPVRFEYHAPTALDVAIDLLSTYGRDAILLAGGTDILIKMKQSQVKPRHVINIKNIEELSRIEDGEKGINIGAATRLRNIVKSELIKRKLPLLNEAIRSIGSVQIRNMATIGGNLCNASPAADGSTALLALNSEAVFVSPEKARKISLEKFFIGPGQTTLRQNEMLVKVFVPHIPKKAGTAFIKIGRTSLDLAAVNIAIVLMLKGKIVSDCRIALGSVAPTPVRAYLAEGYLKGKELSNEVLEMAGNIVSDLIRPITDLRGTAEFRKRVSKTLTQQALTIARDRAER